MADTVDGVTRFRTREIDAESAAVATASLLARRGLVVWLYRHDHDADAFCELGLFIEDRFLPIRSVDECGPERRRR